MKNNFFFKKQFSNIYKKASKKSEVTSQILYGEKFKILSKNKEWIKIKSSFDNYIGYIQNKNYIDKHFPKYKVCSLKANIFSKPNKKTKWISLLSKKKLGPNKNHNFTLKNRSVYNYVRLNIFPDGGVARIRLYGKIYMGKINLNKKNINLTSVLNGASIVGCNNEHFGRAENIITPGKGKNMGDGWETRRRRDKGFDWLILNSIKGNKINKIEISTHHFKGNFPSHCTLQATYIPNKKTSSSIVAGSNKWKLLLDKVKLSANKTHIFKNKLMKNNKINYIKINIYPDGGISRFKIFGKAK